MRITYLFVVVFFLLGEINANDIKGRLLTPEEGCGLTNVKNTKIIGGSDAKKGAFPWIALFNYNFGSGNQEFGCGGSLITSRHLLTAAHCNKIFFDFVRLGEHDIDTESDGQYEDIGIASVTIHPDFDNITAKNDIAIVTLVRDVEFSDRIRPICLPLNGEFKVENLIGSNPFAAGWGAIRLSGTRSSVLQQVQIPLLETEVCQKEFDKLDEKNRKYELGSTALCAGYFNGGKSSCVGDSGGPLMLPHFENGKFPFYQIGITSRGMVRNCLELPSLYTNVQHFADWIKQTIEIN